MRAIHSIRRGVPAVLAALAMLPAAAPLAAQREPIPVDSLGGLRFRNIGPTIAGGRVSAVAGVPGDANTYYVGAAAGGVWKTTNGGNSWEAVFREQGTASIGAVALSPSNPNVVWVGSGEGNPRNDITNGHGVWRSTDAGRSWGHVGLDAVGQISKMAVDPTNPDVAFVAALGKLWVPNVERGIFKTTDGGKSWRKVLFVNDTTGAVDIAMAPGNPKVLFAGMWSVRRFPWELVSGGTGSGLYRSTDGGETWKRLEEGLPKGLKGRIAVGLAPSDPGRVYAVIESKEGLLYASDDLGDHWRLVNSSHAVSVRPWYFSQINVSPEDADHVYFASFKLMESRDGGKTLTVADAPVHPDHHALWIDPSNPQRLIQGNDGGAFVSTDGARTWRFLNNLPIEQFYSVALDQRTPYHLCGGLQDNSAWCGPSNSPASGNVSQAHWIAVAGGDGEYAVPAPSDSSIVYVDSQNGFARRLDLTTGLSRYIRPVQETVDDRPAAELRYRFNWTTPIAVAQGDANEVYIGANVLFRSTDGGRNWQPISPDLTNDDKSKQRTSGGPIFHDISGAETYNTILSVTLSPSDPRVIWVGTDDGNLQVTRDGGSTWANVRPMMPKLPPEGRFYQVGVSPYDPGTVYVALDRHMFADNHPYVLRGTDYGRRWTRIDAGLPEDQPARVVRESPFQRDFLVLGTDRGLYYSQDAGAHWRSLEGSFPTAPVWDLKFAPQTHGLVAATHGRGLFILDDITPLERVTPQMRRQKLAVVDPAPAVSFFGGAPSPEEPALYEAPNPARGVAITYWLGEKLEAAGDSTAAGGTGAPGASDAAMPAAGRRGGRGGPVKITVLDARGDTVSTGNGSGNQGFNTFVWNLRYQGPARLQFGELQELGSGGGGGRNLGALAVPGTYTVVVSAAGQSQRVQARVLPDPRLPFDPAAAEAQRAAGKQAIAMVDALVTLLNRVHGLQQQLQGARRLYGEDAGVPADSALQAQARALGRRLGELQDSIYNPLEQRGVVQDDIHYLSDFYGSLQRAAFGALGGYYEAPTPQALETLREARQRLDAYVARYNALVAGDVAAYNRLAAQKGAPVLVTAGPVSVK